MLYFIWHNHIKHLVWWILNGADLLHGGMLKNTEQFFFGFFYTSDIPVYQLYIGWIIFKKITNLKEPDII